MNTNEFDFINEGFPLLPETLLLNPPDLLSLSNEIIALNSQLERLYIVIHTQSLRVEVEKAKLSSSLKRVKHDLVSPSRESIQLWHDLDAFREFVREVQCDYDSGIDE